MSKLKLTEIPVKVTVDLPAALHRDLVRYAELVAEGGARPVEPLTLFDEVQAALKARGPAIIAPHFVNGPTLLGGIRDAANADVERAEARAGEAPDVKLTPDAARRFACEARKRLRDETGAFAVTACRPWSSASKSERAKSAYAAPQAFS